MILKIYFIFTFFTLLPLKLCENAQKGIIPYPKDTRHFVVCLVNPPIFGDCGPLCFDKTDNTCKGCPDKPKECVGKATLSIVKSDCHQYYICMDRNTTLAIECPSNQHFSETEKKCVPAIDADCLPFNSWCKNQPDGLRFESKNCYEYYECQKEQIFLKTCNYNEYFHKENSSCVPGFCGTSDDNLVEREPICTQAMEGMKSTHPKCYKYYVCLNKLAYVGQCPTGYYFNATAKKCVIDTNEVCNDD